MKFDEFAFSTYFRDNALLGSGMLSRARRRLMDSYPRRATGMDVRHAKLLNVYGRAAKQDGLTIVPADVALDGVMFRPSFRLNDLPSERIPPVLRVPVAKQFDVAWVRARLPTAFGCTPVPSEGEKTFLEQGFVAVPDGTDAGVAFECSDYYGKTSLTFSQAETDEGLKGRVAKAFWSILLSEPDALADFSGRFEHIGAGVTLEYGCENGEPYCIESGADE
jgi:hypothetical protein